MLEDDEDGKDSHNQTIGQFMDLKLDDQTNEVTRANIYIYIEREREKKKIYFYYYIKIIYGFCIRAVSI